MCPQGKAAFVRGAPLSTTLEGSTLQGRKDHSQSTLPIWSTLQYVRPLLNPRSMCTCIFILKIQRVLLFKYSYWKDLLFCVIRFSIPDLEKRCIYLYLFWYLLKKRCLTLITPVINFQEANLCTFCSRTSKSTQIFFK